MLCDCDNHLEVDAMQEVGGPCERLVGQKQRRSGEDVSDNDLDVA